jgi:hypothetical protein
VSKAISLKPHKIISFKTPFQNKMQNFKKLLCVLAPLWVKSIVASALLVISSATGFSAAADIRLIENALPDPLTMQTASGDQIVAAVRMSCRRNTERAPGIVAEALAVDKVRNLDRVCPIVTAAIEGITPPGGQADIELLEEIFKAAIGVYPELAEFIASCCKRAANYAAAVFVVPTRDDTETEAGAGVPTDDELMLVPVPTIPFGSLPGGGGGFGGGDGFDFDDRRDTGGRTERLTEEEESSSPGFEQPTPITV